MAGARLCPARPQHLSNRSPACDFLYRVFLCVKFGNQKLMAANACRIEEFEARLGLQLINRNFHMGNKLVSVGREKFGRQSRKFEDIGRNALDRLRLRMRQTCFDRGRLLIRSVQERADKSRARETYRRSSPTSAVRRSLSSFRSRIARGRIDAYHPRLARSCASTLPNSDRACLRPRST